MGKSCDTVLYLHDEMIDDCLNDKELHNIILDIDEPLITSLMQQSQKGFIKRVVELTYVIRSSPYSTAGG